MYDSSQPAGGPSRVVPVDLGLVVDRLVAEELTAPRAQSGIAADLDQLPLVVVADLVAEVAEHRAVGLVELAAQASRDRPSSLSARSIVMTPSSCPITTSAVGAREQVEAQSVHRIAAGRGILPDDGESEACRARR